MQAPGILKYVILSGSFSKFAEGNRIVKYCVVVLNYLFGVSKNSQFRENDSVRKKTWLREKSRVFPLLIMSFHKNPKRCDLIWSLNGAKAFPFQLNVRYPP